MSLAMALYRMASPAAVDIKAAVAVDTKTSPAAAAAPSAAAPAAAVAEKGAADRKSTVVTVTGATGFIASHLVKQLLDAGYSVRGTVTSVKPEKVTPSNVLRSL